jgi:hypothetical protein
VKTANVVVPIFALSTLAEGAIGSLPARADKVLTADQAIEIAKAYCDRHNLNSEWVAKFYSGTWFVHEKRPVAPTIDAYPIEYIRASDGAGGRCEGLALPEQNSNWELPEYKLN